MTTVNLPTAVSFFSCDLICNFHFVSKKEEDLDYKKKKFDAVKLSIWDGKYENKVYTA
jgi:hypothetical protein